MNEQNISYLDKYKIVCSCFKELTQGTYVKNSLKWHNHHIKPKSIYPELADCKDNIIRIPSIYHWLVHRLLSNYISQNNATKLQKVNGCEKGVQDFIEKNEHLNLRYSDTFEKRLFSRLKEAYKKYLTTIERAKDNTRIVEDSEVIVNCSKNGYRVARLKKVVIELDVVDSVDNQIIYAITNQDDQKEIPTDVKYRLINSSSKYKQEFESIKHLEYKKIIEPLNLNYCNTDDQIIDVVLSVFSGELREFYLSNLIYTTKCEIIINQEPDILDIDKNDIEDLVMDRPLRSIAESKELDEILKKLPDINQDISELL